jgi:pimeloyl-ACP methyl ester carboxylesterase
MALVLKVERGVMDDLRIPISGSEIPADARWTLAGSLFLPPTDEFSGPRPLLVLLPGGGYARGYFDLPVDGFSEAVHHAAHGTAVVALDHLGVGDSTVPELHESSLEAVAAAIDAAVTWMRSELPIAVSVVVGAGQSMGGHVAVAVQALHRTFDAIALLGSSLAGTTFPRRPGTPAIEIPQGATELEAALLAHDSIDWNWAFHYDPDSVTSASGPRELPHDLASLVATDISAGLPAKHDSVPWASMTFPGFVANPRYGERVAALAGEVDVPVLLAVGERDVTRSFADESAVLANAPRVTSFRGSEMAHMHNFSTTRAQLWSALDEFVASVELREDH